MSSVEQAPLGYVLSEAQPHSFSLIASRPIRVGEYVKVRNGEGTILGLVERTRVGSHTFSLVGSYETAAELSRALSFNPRDKVYIADVVSLGLLEHLADGRLVKPSLPPLPGEQAFEASTDDLASVFCPKGPSWVKVGVLLRNSEVPVSVNINSVASRHLAILAKTGSGKSNLLALLANRISELNGTMVIFDYHGEYEGLRVRGKHVVEPRIDPLRLDAEELADLLNIRSDAERQRSLLVRAHSEALKGEARSYWENLKRLVNEDEQEREIVKDGVLKRIELALGRFQRVLEPGFGSPLESLRLDSINILDLSGLYQAQADLAIASYLEALLEDRKRREPRFPAPVVCALEEAHTFLPADGRTRTKGVAAQVAREGRKFGLSLILISQRPSRLDQDALSQMGSLAIMNLSQPRDQGYVSEATGELSEQLASYLPSLNPGEAVLVGQWVVLPTLAKLELVGEKLAGRDLDAVQQWALRARGRSIAQARTSEFLTE
jgi:DNA helicase HerA-like ATPase